MMTVILITSPYLKPDKLPTNGRCHSMGASKCGIAILANGEYSTNPYYSKLVQEENSV